MTDLKSIIIIDDHALVRKGLRSLLEGTHKFKIIGEAADGYEALRKIETLKPDLALLDLSMPKMDGFSAIKRIKDISPKTKVLVVTMHYDRTYLAQALKNGADGYLLKGADPDELYLACQSLLAGRSYVSSEISGQLIEGFLTGTSEIASPLDALTSREMEVMKLVAEGHTNKAVANILFISPKTVDKHRTNLMRKLSVHNLSQLREAAREFGVLEN